MRLSIPRRVKNLLRERSDGICELCEYRAASEVDHIKPIWMWRDPYDARANELGNLQHLCSACHKVKTAEQNPKSKRASIDPATGLRHPHHTVARQQQRQSARTARG